MPWLGLRSPCGAPSGCGAQVRTANSRGEAGAATLLLVLLDAFMDSVFPVLTLLGDAVDGIARLSVRRPEPRHVVLAKRVKQQLHKILKHAWQAPPPPPTSPVLCRPCVTPQHLNRLMAHQPCPAPSAPRLTSRIEASPPRPPMAGM